MIFRCDKYDKGKHQREAINGINEVDGAKLQVGNKIQKRKPLFAESFLKARRIFGQFLMRAFKSSWSLNL